LDKKQSLARRAMVAVILTVGFYVLALVMAGLLLYIPYAEMAYAGRLHLRLTLFCLVGAGLILWSVLPRWDRFTSPGPQLLPNEQPDLFKALGEIAAATGQPLPAEVYATAEMNAWVMDRGGLLGIGSRRVMTLGLPLLRILSVSQLKAVIAHEFGHFHGGDTRLGPWIYRTRQALTRTVQSLGKRGSALQKPFLWYGRMFMKITQGISRSQEYTADRLAARVAGSEAVKSALIALHSKGGAYDNFWENEFVPVLRRGFHPPMLEGYSAFIASPSIEASLRQLLSAELENGETDTFDSHPSLRDRLAALEKEATHPAVNNAPADSLLREPQQLEREVILSLVGAGHAADLKPLKWDEATAEVWLPLWRKTAGEIPDLPNVGLAALPDLLQDRTALAKSLTGEENPTTWEEERDALLGFLLAAATVVALEQAGWKISALPGQEVTATLGERDFTPFGKVQKLVHGGIPPEEWQAICAEAGVGEVRLAVAYPLGQV
jgi:heat shock protein HtpX